MSGFKSITNTDELLSEVIEKVLPSTKEVYFLVGFFYFSGFKEIWKGLSDKKIKILVGMEAGTDINQAVENIEKLDLKKDSSKSSFVYSIKEIFNKTDFFDNEENIEIVNMFIDKILDGSLEIRRTVKPNHSKIYLFEHKDEYSQSGLLPGTVISGSSNLSLSGLKGRYENNYIFWDSTEFTSKRTDFLRIWDNESLPLTTGGEGDDIIKMLKQETWLKLTKPYYCYLRLLYEYFKDEEQVQTPYKITKGAFQDLEYQVDAIKKGTKILNEHNGVIIADVVGLGKSIIGSALLKTIDEKALIIAPPHLVDQWQDYKKDFGINAEIFSSGAINKALEYDLTDIHKAGVILVDEAHKYRNADTIDYGNLHQICQGKKVILLSATPFNNEPNDIFNLIKLFQIPQNPTIHTKKGLIQDFKDLQNDYIEIRKLQREPNVDKIVINTKLKKISNEIRQIIGPVVVRRSRVDLKEIDKYREDLEKQGYDFSKVGDPKELTFELGDIEDLYIETLSSLVETNDKGDLVNFTGARYKALTYIDPVKMEKYEEHISDTLGYEYALLEGRQKNMPFFIRRLLVSRFESSIFAFRNTLGSIIGSIDNMFDYIDKLKGVPVIKKGGLVDIEDIFDSSDDSIEIEDLEKQNIDNIKEYVTKKEGIIIPIEDLKEGFLSDLESDRNFLNGLLEKWNKVNSDPKLDSFIFKIQEIQKQMPERKIVVFSQYSDTVDYLESKLSKNARILKVTGKHKTETLKQDIKLNFDAGIEISKQKNDYDIILGTDAISEGYNLHRAGIIINYDIPYNPTKVIQRIGRINRINKKVYEELFIYNYFPSSIGAQHINIKQISILKIKMIATVLGVDVKTLSGEEEISSFYKGLISEDSDKNDNKSWDTDYFNDLQNAIKDEESIVDKIHKIPQRTRLLRIENKGVDGVLVFAKKKSNLIFYFYDNNKKEIVPITTFEAFALFKANINEDPKEVSKKFYSSYEILRQQIKKPNAVGNKNTQETKALDKAKDLYRETKDDYFRLLIEVIELSSLPLIYMKKLRKITKFTWQKESIELKELISEEYLKGTIENSKNIDEQSLDLIISEEFNK